MTKPNIIFSTNNNPSYYQFWDAQYYIWSALGANPILLGVENDGYLKGLPHQHNIIEVPATESGHASSVQLAQISRLYYAPRTPRLNIISDLDLFPLRKDILSLILPPQPFRLFFTPCYDHYKVILKDAGDEHRIPMQYFSFMGDDMHTKIHQGQSFKQLLDTITQTAGLDWNADEMFLSSFFYKNPQLLSHSPSTKLLGKNHEGRVEPWDIENFSFSPLQVADKIDIHFHIRNWTGLKGKIKDVRRFWKEQLAPHENSRR